MSGKGVLASHESIPLGGGTGVPGHHVITVGDGSIISVSGAVSAIAEASITSERSGIIAEASTISAISSERASERSSSTSPASAISTEAAESGTGSSAESAPKALHISVALASLVGLLGKVLHLRVVRSAMRLGLVELVEASMSVRCTVFHLDYYNL